MLAHQKKQRQSYSRRIVSESDLKRFSRANSRRITVILDDKSGLISSSSSGSSTAVSGETPKITSKIEDYDIQKLNDIDDNDINNNNDDDNDDGNNNKGNDDNISSSSVSNPSTPRIFASKLEIFNEKNNNVNDIVNNPNQEDEEAIIHRQQQLLLSQHQQQQQLSPLNVINEVTVMDVNGKIVFHSLLRRKDVWFLDVSDLDAMDPDAVIQYVAHRSPPQPDLVLTRVPELRHLVYVKHDEEGRPYPIKMRKVVKAHTKKKHMSGKLQEEIIQEEVINEEHTITQEHFQQINDQKAPENTTVVTKSRSFWDMFSISLIKTTSESLPSAASSIS